MKMRIIQYDFSKIDKTKYSFSEEIIPLIKSGFENLKEKNYDSAIRDCRNGKEICEKLKVEAIKEKDEYSANLSFLFEVYYELIIAISNFWKLCDNAEYQDAWSFLQDALDTVSTLNRFIENESQLSIDKISKYLSQIEKLYPYVNFCSIGYITKKMTCSICKRSPYDPECNHIAGDLYWGEMAIIVVEEMEGREVSLVKNPVDKRCVGRRDIDKNKLEYYGISFNDIENAIKSKNMNLPGGDIKSGKSEILIRTMGEFETLDQIRFLIIRSLNNGAVIRLRDIAEVVDTYEKKIAKDIL